MGAQINTRRLKRLEIDPQILIELLAKGVTKPFHDGRAVITEGVPDGAKAVGAAYDSRTGSIVVVFEHDSFDEVPEFNVIPPFTPTIRREYN